MYNYDVPDEEFHNTKECREVYFNSKGIFNTYAKTFNT